jgi:hypothetical protein
MANFPDRPDYVTLRLAADLSSGIRGQTVWFNYSTEEGLAITGPGLAGAPPPPIPVFTPASADSRPMVRSATISVEGYGSTRITADTCSALFWSESAVEKFLLPYYVSAGGQSAFEVLHAINHAWNDYRALTPVVALAFGYPSRAFATPVTLLDTLSVVFCLQGTAAPPSLGTLVVQPLREFLASQNPPPPPNMPDASRFSWGAAPEPANRFPTPIDSVGAREVAEYVSGLREQVVNVYERDDDGGLEATLALVGNATPLFTAFAPVTQRERPPVSVTLEVTTTFLGMEVVASKELRAIGQREANVPDSVFWTDGAVENLLLPYYASVEGLGAPWYLMLILGKWSGMIRSRVLDAVTLREEVLEAMPQALAQAPGGTTRAARTDTQASDVFAIVHLPDSEWIDQAGTASTTEVQSTLLENRTWCLTPTGDHPLVAPGVRLVPHRRVTG